MTKVLAFKEKAERSVILQEIWRWRYKFLICFFGTFFGIYLLTQTGEFFGYILILNYLGYYVGIETMGYIRDRKSLDMYMSIPCSMRKTLTRKLVVSVILSAAAIGLGIWFGYITLDNQLWSNRYYRDYIFSDLYSYIRSLNIYEDYVFSKLFNICIAIKTAPIFLYSFTCGVVGSIITKYVSVAIVATLLTKWMFFPIIIFISTHPLATVIESGIKSDFVLRICGFFIETGDFGVVEAIYEIWWMNFVLAAVNICIAFMLIGMVRAERSTRVFLSVKFEKTVLYFLTFSIGLIAVELALGISNTMAVYRPLFIIAFNCCTYYLVRFLFRKDIKMKVIPWFLIISCALSLGLYYYIMYLDSLRLQ